MPKRLSDPEFCSTTVNHGFFSRHGGVSGGIYESLNCGLGSDDRAEDVRENLRLVASGMQVAHLLTLKQTHSSRAVTVDAEFLMKAREGAQVEADAMVSCLPNVGLGILSADCAPVLFADPKRGIIGAAHAGWKGAIGGVLSSTLTAMEGLGAERGEIRALVGPCIGQDSYAVGQEFYDRFCAEQRDAQMFFVATQNEKYDFNLEGYILHQLRISGIKSAQGVGVDTYPKVNGYFSNRRRVHRHQPDYGRQISVISI